LDRIKILKLIAILWVVLTLTGCENKIPHFNEQLAYDYLVAQCAFGPRVPNSPAHDECKEYLFNKLKQSVAVCRLQEFSYRDTIRNTTLELANILASFNPDKKRRIMLCAHWDCRPTADHDPDSSKHDQPVPGANDGASGVAVLLVVAEILKDNPLPIGVDIVFFDGEDYGIEGEPDQWLIGSKYFVNNIGSYRPRYVILLDLIGDADLNIYKEYYSMMKSEWLVNRFWKAAELEAAEHFYQEIKHSVYDDHIPFLEIGIPAIDIIDFDYKWWHTVDDIPENCSASSLGEVGRVLVRFLYEEKLREG